MPVSRPAPDPSSGRPKHHCSLPGELLPNISTAARDSPEVTTSIPVDPTSDVLTLKLNQFIGAQKSAQYKIIRLGTHGLQDVSSILTPPAKNP